MSTLILGAMFRAIGAYPSGWRSPGAHSNPLEDPAVIRDGALAAERAGLHYIFFGDWLATGPDLEYRDPYLVARIEPLTAATFLAGITTRIGLIATVNSTYADPYSIARATASADILSGGRLGLNLVTGAEPRAAGNHGRDAHLPNEDRYNRAEEFVEVLRSLWDSFEDGAILADKENGRFFDPVKLHSTDFSGSQLSVTGPLNAARPVQGHVPIVHAGTSARSRQLVSEAADLALVAGGKLEDIVALRGELRARAVAAGRDVDQLKVITPIAPIVAPTREEAWDIFDGLIQLIPLDDGSQIPLPVGFPTNRSLAAFAESVGITEAVLAGDLAFDDTVTASVAASFNEEGQRLLQVVTARTGRVVDGQRPITFRHLIVNQVVTTQVLVGSTNDIADHLERWFTAGAVDGFNILAPIQPTQFTAFLELVVPELVRRGLFTGEYSGTTLRENLGLRRPANVHAATASDLPHSPQGSDTPSADAATKT